MKLRYDVEVNHAETGDETRHLYLMRYQVTEIIRSAKDGDDIVIHVKEEQGGEL